MCDSHCRFIYFDVSNPGGQPDINCYTNSQLYNWIQEGLFPNESIVGGDKAFLSQQGNHLFTPFSNPELDRAKRIADNGATYNMMVVYNLVC